MLTPKEKAEELVSRFKIILMDENTDCGNEILCTLIGIKSTKIMVEEIISLLLDNHEVKYWKEVKEELNFI
jgi:hypothetical protein